MKKYLRLTCTLCRRDIDKLVDTTHYTPDRCTITQGCEGRLQPVEYRSSAGIAVTPEVGVKDWQPRGSTTVTNVKLQDSRLVNLETGSLKQLVIASPRDGETLTLVLEGKTDTPKDYRSYIFRKEEAFTNISGIESGLEKKALRFNLTGSSPDMVEVFVNGVKRERGTGENDFQVGGDVPPNTISFNKEIDESGITQIDVIVSKDKPATQYNLVFNRNKYDESRVTLGAYENVDYVEVFEDKWVKYYLYTLDLDTVTSKIPLNSILVPTADSNTMFLMARRPYSQVDRYSTIALKLQGLSADRDYIKYYSQDSSITARATDTSLVNIFPPLRFGKFTVEKPITVATAGFDEQLVIDGKVITGPDS